jgi:hypothetical protein
VNCERSSKQILCQDKILGPSRFRGGFALTVAGIKLYDDVLELLYLLRLSLALAQAHHREIPSVWICYLSRPPGREIGTLALKNTAI